MTNPEASQGEQGPTELVTNMTPERIVTVAMNTNNIETLRGLRLELISRSANIPQGERDILLEQAYAIVNDRWTDMSMTQSSSEL